MSIASLFISPPSLVSTSPNSHCNSISASSSSTNGNTTSSSSKTHTPKPRNSSKSLRIPPPFKTNFNNNNKNPSTNTSKTQSPNPNSSFQSLPWIGSNETIKMPTPPWMSGPLLIPSDEVLDLSKIRKETNLDSKSKKNEWSLTEKIRGGRGKKAMRKIVDSITKLKDLETEEESVKEVEAYEFRVPLEGILNSEEKKMPWTKTQMTVFPRMKKEKVVTAAEKELPESVLKKLRGDAMKMTQWVKAKKAGVTQDVVDEIKMIWKANELAMIKFQLPLSRYMDRAREIVEFKTGGLVVWSKKDAHVVYRGCRYKSPSKVNLPAKVSSELHSEHSTGEVMCSSSSILPNSKDDGPKYFVESQQIVVDENVSWKGGKGNSSFSCIEENVGLQPVHGTLYEREADRLLDGLGPRFIDWWWPNKPLPVDGDLLPEVVPGFRPPFRRCPPRIKRQLTDSELTYLRKSARPLPTHFALGRNKNLQGLAAAMIKLWEKSPIVKIAVKCGVQGTDHEQMAWELKRLTGGVLILRNKFFIIFYRGKDFLPPRVNNLIVNRETELKRCQLQEEGARWKATESLHHTDEIALNCSPIGTVSEFQDIQTKYGYLNNDYGHYDVQHEAEKVSLEKELRKQKRKLFILEVKMERSLKELSKLKSPRGPVELVTDQEIITEEERECFRKIGLKMHRTLVLGRRGVFDGIIGSMHLHWKHREVVKVITMQRSFSQVLDTASVLEIESGGILVAVERLRKGHAIILYRGKNYRRPLKLLTGNLLTKRAALTRSFEMQRTGSLKFFAKQRQRVISNLERKLRDLQSKDENVAPKAS